jgi:nudix-type nucleoside diphosphatase (YffH/AdpP family)
MPQDTFGERIVAFKLLHDGWSKFGVATVQLPDGTTFRREIEDHGSAAAVLPYDPQARSVLLVKQFRAPIAYAGDGGHTLEAPAGIVEQESAEAGARREALEETGIALGDLELVAVALTMPGVSTERMHLFLAPFTAAQRIEQGGGVASEHENVEIVEIGLDALAAMADAGQLVDLKTLTLVLALRLRHPQLFGR